MGKNIVNVYSILFPMDLKVTRHYKKSVTFSWKYKIYVLYKILIKEKKLQVSYNKTTPWIIMSLKI